jgi:hypothetical protein
MHAEQGFMEMESPGNMPGKVRMAVLPAIDNDKSGIIPVRF